MRSMDRAILSLLYKGEAHTVEIENHLKSQGFWLVEFRKYHALDRLEAAGHVTRYEGRLVPERGNRPRIWYAITEQGRAKWSFQDREDERDAGFWRGFIYGVIFCNFAWLLWMAAK